MSEHIAATGNPLLLTTYKALGQRLDPPASYRDLTSTLIYFGSFGLFDRWDLPDHTVILEVEPWRAYARATA